MRIKQTHLISCSVFALIASPIVNAESIASAPTLESGLAASVAAIILTPSTSNETYIGDAIDDQLQNITPGYDVGIDANIAYFFEDTANGIEAFYRGYNTSESNSATNNVDTFDGTATYDLNTFDLMFSQFLDVGNFMQMRFLAGASYLEVKQDKTTVITDDGGAGTDSDNSKFTGWGPRLSIDTRYGFNEDIDGFGFIAGGSVAYLLGDLNATQVRNPNDPQAGTLSNNLESQNVTNLRGNIGLDYVYFFDNDEKSTLGVELGYLVDFYNNAINNVSEGPYDLTFSGPYVELKGAF